MESGPAVRVRALKKWPLLGFFFFLQARVGRGDAVVVVRREEWAGGHGGHLW